jgi:NADH dehydrogenase
MLRTALIGAVNVLQTEQQKPSVVVVGYGWAGRAFSTDLDKDTYNLTIVSRKGFVNTPLLVDSVAMARAKKALPKTAFKATVLAIDAGKKSITTTNGTIHYDYLVVACGSEPQTFNVPGVLENAYLFKTAEHAKQFWSATYDRLVIIGGGAVGIELAFSVRQKSPHVHIMIIEAAPQMLAPFSKEVRALAESQLIAHKIQFMKGVAVNEVLADGVRSADIHIPANAVVWAAGIKYPPWLPFSRPSSPYLSVSESIYALGDIVGPPSAQNAVQQGKYLARRFNEGIQATTDGEPYKYNEYAKILHCGDKIVVDSRWGAFTVPSWWTPVLRLFYGL